jgi:hypothetical protein
MDVMALRNLMAQEVQLAEAANRLPRRLKAKLSILMPSLPTSAKLQSWKESKAKFWPTLVWERTL